ncbi:sulfotransferase [Marilutibacter alkalisoli]|uniref:Sulfotransferase n=1 Tax=Marilutibacter alkalisoli TaxID=2591633 RepID=A0A514BVH1_9GAMM|nr:sulfotransferase [Lysobacter alkalisoli]QDH71029.1 sulfotransferase [Lysobacter alkalisoli]
MPKEILLHAGHGKTGTSYIQGAIIESLDRLNARGIEYPIAERTKKRALEGLVTHGNIRPVTGAFTECIGFSTADLAGSRLLISSESIFKTLHTELLDEIRAQYPKTPISALLLVRDPVGNVASSYQQAVKKGFKGVSFKKYLRAFNQPKKAVAFYLACKASGIDIRVESFSRNKSNLLEIVGDWLGVPEGTLVSPKMNVINRSLTRSEMYFQSALNDLLPYKAAFLSEALCSKLPDIRHDNPKESRDTLETFAARMRADIEVANELFGKELYCLDSIEPYVGDEEHEPLAFSQEQLDVIASAIAEKFLALEAGTRSKQVAAQV